MGKKSRIDIRFETKDEDAIKKICETTGETKTDLILRLLWNEFHLLTDKPELIANKLEDITERRFQRLFDKLGELQEDIKDVQENTSDTNSVSRKILSCLLLCNRDVMRSFFVISRVLYDEFKLSKEKIDPYVKKAIVNTGYAMKDTITTLDWGLKRIADFLTNMGNDIKSEELK